MTYKDYFVAEVKCNGRILRVIDDKVYLPFGSEYSLLLKNLNTRRARVNISIDGQDVLESKSIVLNNNETTELMGFMKNNVVSNRFKFIEKTSEISNYRGDRVDDGLIRIEFAYEKPYFVDWKPYITHWPSQDNWYNYRSFAPTTYTSSSSSSSSSEPSMSINNSVSCYNVQEMPDNDQGITVKGSEVKQDFHYTTFGDSEPSQVIVLKLVGRKDSGQFVEAPREVKTRCSTCGRTASGAIKYCPNCGTYLL